MTMPPSTSRALTAKELFNPGVRPANIFVMAHEKHVAGKVVAELKQVNEFARGLTQLMNDPVRRQTMGAVGGRRVETELVWCHSVPHLLAAYNTMLAERDGQGCDPQR
jgi:hypothetical protein